MLSVQHWVCLIIRVIVMCLVCFQLYDKISSKVISPNRSPPSDVVSRCRDALDIIRDFERSVSPTDIELDLSGDFEELRQILTSAHLKVRVL